jgi:hypothetical protein
LSGRRGWLLAAVVFLGLAAGAAGFVLLTEDIAPRLPSLPAQSPTSLRLPSDTPPHPRSEATSSTLPGLAAEVRASMDEIQRQVAALRGLDPLAPVNRSLLTPEDLRQRILDEFLSDYTEDEAAVDSRLLVLLGLLDPNVDLRTLYTDLLSEQVAGYYDDEAPAMFVVRGAGFAGPERLTYAHEYDHALQDQNFDIDEGLGYNDEACDVDRERCTAVNALLEGDATLLQAQWLRTFGTDQDRTEIQEFFATYESPVYDRAPQFLQKDLLFPYLQGLDFVSALFIEGDWAAVDEAYLHPPTSTEQILHPERYPDDVPIALEVPDPAAALGDGWNELRHEPLGEWTTLLTLEALLPSETAAEAAEGWGGDTVIVLSNEAMDQQALLLVTRWDTLVDAQEFLAAFTQYGNSRFGRGTSTTTRSVWADDERYSSIERSADQTLWILAPDPSAGEALRQAIPLPVDLR